METGDRSAAPSLPGIRLLQARRTATAPVRIWRRSLRVRTVAITVLLSAVALLAVGTLVSFSIERGLFTDRLNQVLSESRRATTAAQTVLDTATSDDPAAIGTLRFAAIGQVRQVVTGLAGTAWYNSPATDPTQPAIALPEYTSPSGIGAVISTELRTAVERSSGSQHWQSVSITSTGGDSRAGIVVGDALQFGPSQHYELYLVYDIGDVQATLDFVQRTLLIGGLALLLLIGAVTAVVVSLVITPIKEAAEVSEELAAGRLERRIPERGEDVVATLARSFNRMAESLQRQITKLANLSRVQQRFVSDVSHELRTPLTTIRLASDVLYDARERFDPPTARSAELLRDQVERFEALLADLLEISRMDAQAAEVAGEPTNLVAVAKEAIDSLSGLADDMGTSVQLVTPGGHVEVEADPRRIARIVRNLVANAIEHGEGRPVVVTVDSSEEAVGLGVRDHGIGMKQEDTERVFDRFWRADPSRQRRIGGTGLGLAISMEDALLHGGTIEVWSRIGDGTNFVLTLPRTAGDGTARRPVPLRPVDAAPETASLRAQASEEHRRPRTTVRL